MPSVMISPLAARPAARLQSRRKASALPTTWSEARATQTASGSRFSAMTVPTAMAAAESRRSGSSTISPLMPSASICSAAMKRKSLLVMTIGGPKAGSTSRCSVAWKVERPSSSSGMNCFGMVSRDSGQRRVPEPPAMTRGTIFAAMKGFRRYLVRQFLQHRTYHPINVHRGRVVVSVEVSFTLSASAPGERRPPPRNPSPDRVPRSGRCNRGSPASPRRGIRRWRGGGRAG
jgi:hypothetical protein